MTSSDDGGPGRARRTGDGLPAPNSMAAARSGSPAPSDALYERHLMFDNVVDPAEAGRARSATRRVARSDAGRPVAALAATEQTYERENPKRVYYLSMEFLIGRSLANNILNLLPRSGRPSLVEESEASTGWRCSRRSPTPASATAGSAASPPASSTRWRRWSSRRWATGCATSTASSGRPSRTAGSASSRTTGCGGPIPGRSPGRRRRSKSSSAARSRCDGGTLRAVLGQAVARCSACPTIARSSATAARPSTHSGSGPPPRRMSSTSRRSAPATS